MRDLHSSSHTYNVCHIVFVDRAEILYAVKYRVSSVREDSWIAFHKERMKKESGGHGRQPMDLQQLTVAN